MRNPEIAVLAADVARCLGPGWTPEPDDDYHGMHIANGPMRLYISPARGTDAQIHVSGTLPQTHLRVDRGGINVSKSRGPRRIAADIQRRLLPRYQEALDRVLSHQADQAHNHRARQDTLGQIADMFPGSHVREINSAYKDSAADVVINARCGASGTIHAFDDAERLSIELRNVPADFAIRMLDVLLQASLDANGVAA
jgi:hypothetical protein